MYDHILNVSEEHDQSRLDVYLTKVLTDIPSRNFVKRLIEEGNVSVNEKKEKPHHKVTLGDKVCVNIPPRKDDGSLKPEKIALNIVYEDRSILLIDKPIGMLVHPANTKRTTGTLVNALLYYCKKLSNLNTEVRPGIVHRLDRETSGLILVAKDNKAHAKLAKQFENHLVKKQYLALVEGSIEFDEGVIDVSLDRHPKHHDKKIPSFSDRAKEAKTYYRVVKKTKGATLVQLFPQTGRTHQLRVHLAYLGHPVLGDEKYGKKNSFSRLALHSQSIGFKHPVTDEYMEFSIKPPEEFVKFTANE